MPSQLVDEVRRLIAAREEARRPLTSLERAFLMAAITPRRNVPDLVDELEEAIALGRSILLGTAPATLHPAQVDQMRRQAAARLLAAARAVLDHDPAREPAEDYDPTATAPQVDHGGRPERADVDG